MAARGDHRELERRAEAVRADDPYTFIYTSGTTGPPKGCVLSHGNFRAVLDMIRERDSARGPDDTTYLFLPLAHALALIMQLSSIEAGGAIAYFGGDPRGSSPELAEVAADVPALGAADLREGVRARSPAASTAGAFSEAVRIGGSVEDLRRRGVGVPRTCSRPLTSSMSACSAVSAPPSAGGCAWRSPGQHRWRRRSSSSSGRAACR